MFKGLFWWFYRGKGTRFGRLGRLVSWDDVLWQHALQVYNSNALSGQEPSKAFKSSLLL